MTRRKRKDITEEQPVEELVLPVEEQTLEELAPEPTEEITGAACSNGYDMEVPRVYSLIVDATTLALLLNGSFRPYKKYDQVNFQAVSIPAQQLDFSLYLAFRALRPGGLFWVKPELAEKRIFRDCSQVEMGGLVRITKK
jgi:hypothetical protein